MKKWLRLFLVCMASMLLAGCGMPMPGEEVPGAYSRETEEPAREETKGSLTIEKLIIYNILLIFVFISVMIKNHVPRGRFLNLRNAMQRGAK